MRDTRREMVRRELKPTYLKLPPLSKGCIWSKRSSQGQPGHDYFERRRRQLVKLILIQGVKSDLNRHLARVRGATGAISGTSKRTRNCSGTQSPAEKQPTKRRIILPEVSYRDAALNFKMAIVTEKYPEDKLVEEDIKDIQSEILQNVDGGQTWRTSTSPQNLLSARRSIDLFL